MKNSVKYILAFLLIILCSGCMKIEGDMEIKSNKAMNLKILFAVDESKYDEIISKEEQASLSNYYDLKEYKKDKYKGYILSYKVSNIDKLSSISEISFPINSIRSSVPSKMFTIHRGWFTNTYKANFTFNPEDFATILGDEKLYKCGDKYLVIGSADKKGEDCSLASDEAYSFKFKAKIGGKVLDNNAAKVNKNIYTWDLKDSTSEINFRFSLINFSHIIMTIIISLLLFGGLFYKVFKSYKRLKDI